MGVYTYTVSDLGLGTSTAKTKLSGDQSGNANDWTLPASCRGILRVQPYFYVTTPTSTQTAVASLKVESDDLGVKDYEVLAPPVGGNIATTDYGSADLMRTADYPAYWATQGGEKVSFYGIAQTANTAAPNMGADIVWTDDIRNLTDLPFRARIGGTAGAAGSGTNTGTATGSVAGATISIGSSGIRTIREVTGIVAPTTIATVKPIAGYFTISAPELGFNLSYAAEPMQGPLGTAQSFAHLTRKYGLSARLNTPSTLNTSLFVTAAPSTTGNFYQGMLYN